MIEHSYYDEIGVAGTLLAELINIPLRTKMKLEIGKQQRLEANSFGAQV